MGFTMDMLVMCHNFRTILHFIFGQAYAYFVGTLPQYKKAKRSSWRATSSGASSIL